MLSRRSITGFCLILVGLLMFAGYPAQAVIPQSTITPATELPAGFSDEGVFTLANPTAIAFTPDGRMLITQDAGKLRVAEDDALQPGAVLNVTNRICAGGERGMMGVAVDPNFTNNKYIYVYWTFKKFGSCPEGTAQTPVNRVTRYKLRSGNQIVDGSAKVLINNLPSPASNHNAGDLHFGANGLLYVSVGDGGCEIGSTVDCGASNGNSRRLDIPNGKLLRINRAGKVPASNPFVGTPGARRCTKPSGVSPGDGPCTETFAHGLRNPFRFAVRPGTNQILANDVGQNTWEEIDHVQSGNDYGWNVREGFCLTGSTVDCTHDARYTDPLFAYDRSTDCRSVTGAAFVPEDLWGDPYAGQYLFADLTCDSIFRLVPSKGGTYDAVPFAPAQGPVELTFGPAPGGQALYYLEYFTGKVRRISGP